MSSFGKWSKIAGFYDANWWIFEFCGWKVKNWQKMTRGICDLYPRMRMPLPLWQACISTPPLEASKQCILYEVWSVFHCIQHIDANVQISVILFEIRSSAIIRLFFLPLQNPTISWMEFSTFYVEAKFVKISLLFHLKLIYLDKI